MKNIVVFLLVCLIFDGIYSFPHFAKSFARRERTVLSGEYSLLGTVLSGENSFPDADHPYIAPGPDDQRGPCPGLNAAANHGYIPRNGIATFAELVQMQTTLYNFDLDLATLLTLAGIFFDGDLTTLEMSIGGNTTNTSLTNSVTSYGLDYHATLETDASASREDFFLNNGDSHSFSSKNFALTYNASQIYGNGTYNFEAMTEVAYLTIQRSIALNPHFFFGIFQFIFHYPAIAFYTRIFPNGTDGIPSQEMINSFIGIINNGNGTFSHIPERIPSNWYHPTVPYTLEQLFTDVIAMQLAHPVPLGANDGQNNYIPGNPDSTGPTRPLPSNLDVRDLGCIIYQSLVAFLPSTVSHPLLKSILDPIFVSDKTFNCTSLLLNT